VILAAILLQLAAAQLPATIPNPRFERGLEGWTASGERGFRAGIVSSYPASPRRRWLTAGWAARSRAPDDSEFNVSTRIDARRYRGRRIMVSARIRARGDVLFFASAHLLQSDAAIAEEQDWRRYSIILPVIRQADSIEVGFQLRGGGARLEADDVRVRVLR
jgi:hypothetical protein